MKTLEQQLHDGDITPEQAEVIRLNRVVVLLDQVRSIGWGSLFLLVAIGMVAIIGVLGVNSYRREQNQRAKENRVAICDLYRQVDIVAPPALRCMP